MNYFSFTLLFALMFALLVSCTTNDTKILNSKNVYIEIAEAPLFLTNTTNTSSIYPLEIKAEKLELKKIIDKIFYNDSLKTTFKYASESIANKNLKATIQFTNDNYLSKKEALNFILKTLQLKVEEKEFKTYKFSILDSLKLKNKHSKKQKNNTSKIYKSKDSLSLEHISLKYLAEFTENTFNLNIINADPNFFINGNFSFKNFKDYKTQLKKQFGLSIEPSNTTLKGYLISENSSF